MQKSAMLGKKTHLRGSLLYLCLDAHHGRAAMLRQTCLFEGVLPVWQTPAACQQLVCFKVPAHGSCLQKTGTPAEQKPTGRSLQA